MEAKEIDILDLVKWQCDAKILYASDDSVGKKIYAFLNLSFEVWHNDKMILRTVYAKDAVACYNSIGK